eukprot:scaffold59809_cov37-Phaeocystis_antarctica.AAC.2
MASLPAHFAAATSFSDPSTPPRVSHATRGSNPGLACPRHPGLADRAPGTRLRLTRVRASPWPAAACQRAHGGAGGGGELRTQ